jgi:uncharacterized caspase-like protein/peptidoglycan hydrolase-like protein with peptidoglycan-binding domain
LSFFLNLFADQMNQGLGHVFGARSKARAAVGSWGMLRRWLSAVALAASVLFGMPASDAALADRRVALVIGNSNYNDSSLNLSNPLNDATDVAKLLRVLGFNTIEANNASKRDFELALGRFAQAASQADSVLFYYAGHAMQYQGTNYLMPVDARLENEFSIRFQMVSLDDVRAAIDRANGVKIMILDACRNNPLAERLRMQLAGQSRNIGQVRGLARIDKTQGMVVAYATAADQVALDGKGRNSPYTTALLQRMVEPGLEIGMMFRQVTSDVYEATNGRQRPATYMDLTTTYFLNQSDRLAWDRVRDSTDPEDFREFIRRFPASPHALTAKSRVEMFDRFARERKEAQELLAKLAEQRRLLEEETNRRRLAEEEEAKRRAAERQRAEQEAARRREAEDQKAKEVAAEKERLAREAAERRERERLAAIAAAERQRAEQDAARRREAEEQKARLAAAERERREREAARIRKLEEEALLAAAARMRAEQEAAKRREAEEQQAKFAVAERARQEQEAARIREQEEQARLAAAAAERQRAEQEAAKRREAEKEQARLAAIERARQEQEAARIRAQEEQARLAAAERERAEQEAAKRREAEKEQARLAAIERARQEEEAARLREQEEQARLAAAALERVVNTPREDATTSEPEPTATAVAALENPAVRPKALPEPEANTPELVRAAQHELRRHGCYSGREDGALGEGTRGAIRKYLSERGLSGRNTDITEELVAELKAHRQRACPPPPSVARPAPEPKKSRTATRPPRQAPPPRAVAPEPPAARPQVSAPPPAAGSRPPRMIGF